MLKAQSEVAAVDAVLERGADVSAVRRPGVYVLRERGRVVWVGAAKNPLRRIFAHDTHRRGDPALPGLPRTPVTFDEISVLPCTVDDLDALLESTTAALGWRKP